jgi:23S rRNA pseudouridine1911/1915/1917 synthase
MEPDEQYELTVSIEDHGKFRRLDHYLRDKLPEHSRTFIQNLFKQELITGEIEGQVVSLGLNKIPPVGTILNIFIPPPIPLEAKPENIPLEILYEDEYLLFINKPSGIVVHPAPGNYTGTLVNALLHHIKDLKGIGNKLRPGIVHRLDIGTSGVMVVAKEQKCHEKLVMTFAEHDLDRKYVALVMGQPKVPAGKLESFIARHPQNRLKMAVSHSGKKAITHYRTLEVFPKCTLLEMTLETGRTHQIRVHLSTLLKSPIFNDSTYGNPKENLQRLGPQIASLVDNYPYPFLHAKLLSLKHPITGQLVSFETPPPAIFQDVLTSLRGGNCGP